jgi:outer membrane protein TolC
MATLPLLSLLLVAAEPAVAPPPAAAPPCASIDLASALEMAARRSDEVAIKQAELESAHVDQALARAVAILPGATATLIAGPVPAAHGDVTTKPGDPEAEGTSNRSLNGLGPFGRIDISAVQPLWTWGQITAARDAANAGFAARNHLLKNEVANVQLRVIQLFWARAFATKMLDIAADVEKSLKQVDEKIDEALKNEEGSITTEDRFRVQIFKGEVASRKADAQKGFDLAQIGLAATLALQPDGVKFDTPALDATGPEIPPLAKLVEQAESQRAELLALDEAIHAREAEVRANEAAMLPAFFVAGQFSFAYAPNRDIQFNPWVNDPFRELSGGIVLGARQNLALPLLWEQAEKSKAELKVMQAQRRGLARLVEVEVQSARTEAVAAQTKLAAAQGSLSAGKNWFRTAVLGFGIGTEDSRLMLEAYQGYVQTQVNLASASYDLLVARAKLDRLTGQPLSRGEGKCVLP